MPPNADCWLVAVDEIAAPAWPAMQSALDEAERVKAGRYRFAADRQRFIAGRFGLRHLLAARLGRPAGDIHFAVGPSGKPALAEDGLQFNVSHSGRFVVIAVSTDCAVGVDIEEIRPMSDAAGIARRFFHAEEVAALDRLSGDEALDAFFRCWTRKEAVSKSLGLGLGLALDRFRVSCLPGDAPAVLGIADPGLPQTWTIRDLPVPAGYAAALAAPVAALDFTWRSFDRGGGGVSGATDATTDADTHLSIRSQN